MTAGRLIWLWLPVVAWLTLIFVGSSFPAGAIGFQPPFLMLAIHFLEYLVLGLFAIRAINGGFRPPFALRAAVSAFCLCLIYGVLDEFHQLFVPGRVADPIDLATDAAGAATACVLALLIGVLILRGRNRGRELAAD